MQISKSRRQFQPKNLTCLVRQKDVRRKRWKDFEYLTILVGPNIHWFRSNSFKHLRTQKIRNQTIKA